MKLWLIKSKHTELPDTQVIWAEEGLKRTIKGDNPWESTWDCAYGFVVRAETEEQARQWASKAHGDEGEDAWLSEKYSSCIELEAEEKAGIVIQDFLAG